MEVTKEAMEVVTRKMLELGTPASTKGYLYMRYAILKGREDIDLILHPTKMLYYDIAKHFDTTDVRVEAGIRHLINLVWERDSEHFKKFFDQPNWTNCPSNSKFLKAFIELL